MHACLHVEVEVGLGLLFGGQVLLPCLVVVLVLGEGEDHFLFFLFCGFGVGVGWPLDDGAGLSEGLLVEIAGLLNPFDFARVVGEAEFVAGTAVLEKNILFDHWRTSFRLGFKHFAAVFDVLVAFRLVALRIDLPVNFLFLDGDGGYLGQGVVRLVDGLAMQLPGIVGEVGRGVGVGLGLPLKGRVGKHYLKNYGKWLLLKSITFLYLLSFTDYPQIPTQAIPNLPISI